jgi:transposase
MDTRVRRQYTADYKTQAVSLVESLGVAGAARKLGISAKTLANWVRLERSGTPVSSSKRRAPGDIEAENSRLRAENATLRMERDVLKKATAFFAKESR